MIPAAFIEGMAKTLIENDYKQERVGRENEASFDWLIRDMAYHVAKLGAALLAWERGEPWPEGTLSDVDEHCYDVAVAAFMIWERTS